MKTLQSINEWMKNNPRKEDITKVLNLINKMESTGSRRALYELQKKFNKLSRVEKQLKEIEIPVPGDIQTGLETLKKEIEVLRKGLPEVTRRVKK